MLELALCQRGIVRMIAISSRGFYPLTSTMIQKKHGNLLSKSSINRRTILMVAKKEKGDVCAERTWRSLVLP